MEARIESMGMTDMQFASYTKAQIIILKNALTETPENKALKAYIEELEAGLQKP